MFGRVEAVSRLTPAMVRVVLGGEGLRDFAMPAATDAYVNLAFVPAGAPYGPVFDPREVSATVGREWRPARRRYTVRRWDPEQGRLTLDFVVHGDTGVAGRWAASAAPGDVLVLEGPSGGYRPDPAADWHLLVGDESALPAIAASLEALAPGTPVVVRLLCEDAGHEVPLETRGDLDLLWVHRSGRADPDGALVASLAELDPLPGRVHAFVHGEAEEIRAIRRHLLTDRGLSRADMSCSPYWRRTMSDEDWRAVKRDFVAAMEAETA